MRRGQVFYNLLLQKMVMWAWLIYCEHKHNEKPSERWAVADVWQNARLKYTLWQEEHMVNNYPLSVMPFLSLSLNAECLASLTRLAWQCDTWQNESPSDCHVSL